MLTLVLNHRSYLIIVLEEFVLRVFDLGWSSDKALVHVNVPLNEAFDPPGRIRPELCVCLMAGVELFHSSHESKVS